MSESNPFTVLRFKTPAANARQTHINVFAVQQNLHEQYMAVMGQKDNPFLPEETYIVSILEQKQCPHYGENGFIVISERKMVSREHDYDIEGNGKLLTHRNYNSCGNLDLAFYYDGYDDVSAIHTIDKKTITVNFGGIISGRRYHSFNDLSRINFKYSENIQNYSDLKITGAWDSCNVHLLRKDVHKLNDQFLMLDSDHETSGTEKVKQIANDVIKTGAHIEASPKYAL